MRLSIALLLVAAAPACATRLSDGLALRAQGKLKESRELLQTAAGELRAAGNYTDLARACSALSQVSIALGDYGAAVREAGEAIATRVRLNDESVALSEDYNNLALANQYLGDYDEALANFTKALDLDRAHNDSEGMVERLNNIGGIYYFHGRYGEAFRAYLQAKAIVDAAGNQPWVAARRQLTTANLAALYQRVGKDRDALQFYHQLAGSRQAMPPAEYAQLLLNQGILYRRMGDPVKALEQYGAAQAIFGKARHRDGEIGALRNIGIARALDLGDLAGALEAFTSALALADAASDTRAIVQASLYRAEVLRRLKRPQEAEADLRTALAGAEKSGLPEEQWKALYGLGQLEESDSRPQRAADYYRKAVAVIESVRAGIGSTALRSDFLADKRDVYDALIALEVERPHPPAGLIFTLMERSRARTLEERSRSGPVPPPGLEAIQAAVPPDTVLLDFWVSGGRAAVVWLTHSGAGVLPRDSAFRKTIAPFVDALGSGTEDWKSASRELGTELLAGVPSARHVVVVADGPLVLLPFEVLARPDSGRLLIDDSDVSYLPAARFLLAKSPHRGPLGPWRKELVAFREPASKEFPALSAAGDEVQAIARELPGRSVTQLGAATKEDLLSSRMAGVPLLHFATHAEINAENPDHSRLVIAGGSGSLDSIYLREVYGFDLRGVDLATISACETARGKLVRGDGVQAFSHAFLAAGAGATVTSLWKVADRPTAEFMQQFYYFLSQGQTKSEALRSAKLDFLRSGTAWSAPRYWSAFVLNGDGWDPCARVIPWSWLLGTAAVLLLAAGWFARRKGRTRAPVMAASSPR